MRRPTTFLVLLALSFSFVGSLAYAQSDNPPDDRAKPPAKAATEDEVAQLRREVAELRAVIQRLVEANSPQGPGRAHLVLANSPAVNSKESDNTAAPGVTFPAAVDATDARIQQKKTSDAPATPVVAGFNGEHFFVKSSDGQFQIQPYGYFQTDYRAYRGDGAPPATFVIRRARFGFQGSYGKYYDFAILADAAASNGITLRDLYVTIKPSPAFQVQVGQFKEPFAQEVTTAVTNIDFVERSLASLLYPSVATAFRSPGAMVRGDIYGGAVQYWAGAFNGKGILANNTTNQPEVLGRLRFYPWKKTKGSSFQGLAFGGAIGYGRSRGLSNETSFGGTIPDSAFAFFPTFRINGGIERFNGEFTWTHGPWAVRGEYDQLLQKRRGVGSETPGGIGFIDLPGIRARAGYLQATYLLTGEARPENGAPKVKHAFLGPEGSEGRGWGAWELAFRYDKIRANEPGLLETGSFTPFTPELVPEFHAHTDAFTGGVNWYPNYWVRYMLDFGVDRLKQPSLTGALPQNYFTVLQRLQFRF